MKAFVGVAGALFLLILIGHVARVITEGAHVLSEPIFLTSSVLALGMTAWAATLLLRKS